MSKDKEKKKRGHLGLVLFLILFSGTIYIGMRYFKTDIMRIIKKEENTTAANAKPTPITYAFGGVTLKCYGGEWDRLDEGGNYKKAKEYVEGKYNIKLVRVELKEDDEFGFKDAVDILHDSIESGEPAADIVCISSQRLYAALYSDMLADITDFAKTVNVGSSYINAGTWKNRVYGICYEKQRDLKVIIYDRAYIDELGLDQPSMLFVEGKWNYDLFEVYLRKMKAKLPEDVYPIGMDPYEWLEMAAGANGVVLFDNDGQIRLDDPKVAEALEFYQKLEAEGLAYPMSINYDDFGFLEGVDVTYGLEDERIVLKTADLSELPEDISGYSIVFWPWGYGVKCDDYYLNLPDEYSIPTSAWTIDAAVAESCRQKGISADDAARIIYDYHSICTAATVDKMHKIYENETTGKLSNTAVTLFSVNRDNVLLEWALSRLCPDYSFSVSAFRDAAYSVLCGYEEPADILPVKEEECKNGLDTPFVSYYSE